MASEKSTDLDALRWSEERFHLLVRSVRDYAIYMLDPSGHITSWNPGAEALKGYREHEIVGRHFSTFYPPEDVRAGTPERELEVAAAQGRIEDEGWRVRKDGSRFWANVVISAMRDDDGTLIGFAKVTRDLTERRRAEADRLSLAQAEEGLRIRDEFVALAAHELRNPLYPLTMALQVIEREIARLDGQGKMVARIEAALRQVTRLRRLTEELLDVTRMSTGRMILQLAPVDLAELTREVTARYLANAGVIGSQISVIAPGPLLIQGDEMRLEQVLTNLLSNAIKFGGQKPIVVQLEERAGVARLTVRDQGIGIPAEARQRIFERFQRAVSNQEYAGMGLGLYLCQQIVKAHGGTVSVESEPGQGATFVVELPQQNLRTV